MIVTTQEELDAAIAAGNNDIRILARRHLPK